MFERAGEIVIKGEIEIEKVFERERERVCVSTKENNQPLRDSGLNQESL